MFPPDDGDQADKKALLEELMQFARGGMAKDMRVRHGKPLDPEPDPEPAPEDVLDGGADDALEEDAPPPEDPEIPGVEAAPDDASVDGAGLGSKLDPATLKALLAKMKAG